jgi:hypothetical protein
MSAAKMTVVLFEAHRGFQQIRIVKKRTVLFLDSSTGERKGCSHEQYRCCTTQPLVRCESQHAHPSEPTPDHGVYGRSCDRTGDAQDFSSREDVLGLHCHTGAGIDQIWKCCYGLTNNVLHRRGEGGRGDTDLQDPRASLRNKTTDVARMGAR